MIVDGEDYDRILKEFGAVNTKVLAVVTKRGIWNGATSSGKK